MGLNAYVRALEDLWADEGGFLFQIRMGRFDPRLASEFLAVIQRIECDENEVLSRRAVSLLWYLPLVLQWQLERVGPAHRSDLARLSSAVLSEVERLLGTP